MGRLLRDARRIPGLHTECLSVANSHTGGHFSG